jgi:ribonuclease HII
LIDGNRFIPYKKVEHECVVKGDGKYQSIAAASILAKTYRDEYMRKIHETYPDYGWNHNMGYPTEAHRDAIMNFGITVIFVMIMMIVFILLIVVVIRLPNKVKNISPIF